MKESENTPLGHFWKNIQFLIEPPPDITDTRQRHQAKLLSALLLIIILLGGMSGTVQLLTVPGFFPTFVTILGAVVVLCFAYLLVRTKHYLVAATLATLTPFMASYAALRENTEDQSAFVFMLISVLLSSILLNRWLTLGVAFLNLLGLVLLPVVQPAWTFAVVSGKLSFHVIISALILVAMWHRDVIERDRQRELSESELKFRSIFDNSVDAIGVSRDGVHIMANPAYVRMFGCRSADNLVGRSILDLIAPSERARIQENIRRRALGEDVPAMYETRGLRCDGTEFDMEVHVSTYELEGKVYTVPILRNITERKKAEDALRASEEAYKLLFESNPQPMWVYDSNSLAFLAVNDEAVSKYGFSRDEFLSMTIKDIRPEGEIPRLMDNIAHVSAGLDHAGDWQHLKKDGNLIDVEITSHTLNFEGRKAELVIANDVTARKAAEKALEKSELRYRAIVESTTDLICRFLPDMTLTFVNEAYCRYFGQSRDRLVGTRFLALIPEDDWEGVKFHVNRVFQNRKPVTYSHEVITPQGEIRWQQWTDSTILNKDGEVVELQSVGRDITEQKMAEKSLQESERRFREVLQGVNLAGIMLDRTGRITFINEYLLRITGWSREDALGKDWFDQFLPPDIREDVRMAFGKMLIDNEVVPHYENEIISRHGGRRLVRWNNTTLFDTNGDIIGSASIGEDITESRFMERSLRLSEEKFSKAFRASPDVIVLTSLEDGRILDVNDSLSFLSGYSRDEVVGKTTAELQFWASPADRERYITVLQRDGRVRDLEVGFRIKSGEIRQALLSGEIIELADGKYILGVIRDVTERKKTEQALRSSEERYRLLFENNPQPMWVYDMTTLAFLAVNEAAINAYGYSRDEFLGMTIKDIRPADDLPRLMDNIFHLTGGLDHAGYWRHTKKNGEVIDVEITSHTFLFEGREAELVLATDVTERKRADEALKHSEETAMEFQEKMRTLHEVGFELSGIESLDELYRAAVEAGLKKLGFERFALFLIEEDGRYLAGTYGTDEEGSIRTEHHVREEINDTRNKFILDWLLSRTRSIHLKNVTLHGAGRDLDRRGSNVFAIVWDGSQAIGMVVIDNFLTQRPPQPFVEELLSMYGNVIGHLITRLRNEQALRESEQRYRALFEESPISIWEEDFSLVKQRIETLRVKGVKDFQMYFDSHPEEVAECAALVQVVDVNKAALKIYHAGKKEDLLKSLKAILESSKSLAVFRGELTGIANGETVMYRENIDATLTGELIDVGLSWQVVPGYENSLSKVIVSIIDITTRKQAERDRERLIADLEAKNAELERFTYTVSHDLKSPLVTIKGFLGFLKQDIDSGNMERFNSDLERISNAAQKMEQLLLDLLDLSRIGRLMNPPKDIPFESLVREALELVHGRLEVSGVSVYVQPNLPAIYGDRPRLVEVLQNLIDNAAKYMGGQPKPHIEIGQRGEENGRLVLYVKDNGMGIAPEHHERIFGLFNKLDAQSEGTGVGLALVKRIIEFHGGRIWVEGEAGNGSTFLFTLPPGPSS